MKKICLQDWADEAKLYTFDFDGYLNSSSKMICKDPSVKSRGFCSIEQIGLVNRKRVLITVFSDGQSVQMSFNDSLYCLSDPAIVGKRSQLYWGAKQFTLSKNGEILFSFSYWNGATDSAGIGGEIFEYVERITKNLEHKAEFLKILNAMFSGEWNQNWRQVLANP